MELFGFMLLVPAIIAAAELIRFQYPGLALATVVLVGPSVLLIVGAIFFTMMLAGASGLNEVAIAEYLAATESLGAMIAVLPLFFTALVGYLLLAIGLWRTRATARWVPVLFVVSIVVGFFVPAGVMAGFTSLGIAVASAGMAYAYLVGEEDPTPAIAPRPKALVS